MNPLVLRLLTGYLTGRDSPFTYPPLNASQCHAESCMTMPTDCGARHECQGCGPLCFPVYSPSTTSGFSILINSTGLSEQVSEAFDGKFPPLSETADKSSACQPTRPVCLRGAGNLTLHAFKSSDPESASAATCCAACVPMKGAMAWQMITKSDFAMGEGPMCW